MAQRNYSSTSVSLFRGHYDDGIVHNHDNDINILLYEHERKIDKLKEKLVDLEYEKKMIELQNKLLMKELNSKDQIISNLKFQLITNTLREENRFD